MYECGECEKKTIKKDEIRNISDGGDHVGAAYCGVCPICGEDAMFWKVYQKNIVKTGGLQ